MTASTLLIVVGLMAFTFAVNLPFGRLRAGVPKLSLLWFVYIHLPVPLVIALRVLSGCPNWAIPVLIATAVLGQWVGGKKRKTPRR